jgi:Arc/MetJ-type ribon-helix-helix transcriptional regulator
MKDINNPSDTDTDSTRSLSDSEHDSVQAPDRFFKPAPTELRLKRRDALDAEAITERLRAIHETKNASATFIEKRRADLDTYQAKCQEISDKIRGAVAQIKEKEEENQALKVKVLESEKMIKSMHEKIDTVSFIESVWRPIYTAIYHMFGWKTAHETLCENRVKLSDEIQAMRNKIKGNTQQIKQVEEQNIYDENRKGIQQGLIMVAEKDIIEYKNKNIELEKEESALIQQLPEFKNKSDALNQAIDKMIESCDTLAKPTMLSKIQRTKTTPNAQVIVAQALSEFLKKPTETTQAALAASMQDNPTYTDEPKLQKLLEEAKGYYTEVEEMLKSSQARLNM